MIDALPPLRDVLKKNDLWAKKALGQNFILDLNLTSKIAKSAGSFENTHIIEVGPGPGGLTRAILALNPASLTVIERDQRCLNALEEISNHYPGKLNIIEGDALSQDYAALVPAGEPAKLIANLPYNIATPLLINWLKSNPWPPWFQSMTLMFQREVAERIVAQSGEKHFGRLAIMAGWRTHAHILFDIDPQAFTPPPKVTSSVVHLTPRSNPLPCKIEKLEQITSVAFQKRRKMLRASLKSVFPETEKTLESCGIDPQARAETLEIADFVNLANQL